MGRKTQITRQIILENALQLLLKEGYEAITVKTLAERIGCSTQPIVWHFENMQGFRKAFLDYCIAYAKSRFTVWEGSLDQLLTETAPEHLYRASRMQQPAGSSVTDSSTRLGFYIVTGSSREEVCSLAQLM